ncbi:MAG: 16S rRNA (guanine(527)-N(7))-methyltransferase RsmG [Candidatus Kapaibacterium sp.]
MILLKKFLDEYKLADEQKYKEICLYNTLVLKWNSKVNVISRKNTSIENIVLNSVFFLTKYDIKPKAKVLDIGTGGGFPGIPLKILYPEINLTLCDSIQKKINVVDDIIKTMNLKDSEAVCCRAEELKENKNHFSAYDYIVSKSVAHLSDLYKWGKDLLNKSGLFICIKGGDMSDEIRDLTKRNNNVETEMLEYIFPKEYNIEGKKIILIKTKQIVI